jgi:glycosyltransferase involved in cell wall biosynthesis
VASAFGFDADATVSRRVFQNSPSWQRRQQRAAGGFSHLLVESLIPPFGRLAGRDLHRQLALLGPGVSTAFVCHGTDVRAVRGPTESMSPRDRQADRIASRNRDLLGTFDAPVFVTTPDLIDDVPTAVWLPVVIDQDAWASGGRAESSRPRVLHVPSDSAMKGSAMIEPVVQRLHEQGVIHYQAARQIPHSRMPQMIGSADIVLDQFVLGSYGVAACEAMASGAVVVGHVTDAVRDRVRAATGRRLPIVEATAQSLHDVLSTLAHDSQQRRALADEGRAFAGDVHDGRLSADMLRREWIDTPAGRSNTLT